MAKPISHPYLPNSSADTIRSMLEELGLDDIEQLYADIPENVWLKNKLKIPNSISEYDVERKVNDLLSKNVTTSDIPCFLGAGCWPHHVPAAIDTIVSRSEFLTSYTPYQAETSQGILQALFEYQSAICELTEMEYTNCSMYDWPTALGEVARMAKRATGRNEFLIPHYIDPERVATLKNYSEPAAISIIKFEQDRRTGQIIPEMLEKKVSEKTAAVYIENPSYLGYYEKQVDLISDLTHKRGGLFIVGVDPISLGITRPPGEYGADIVIGEAQPLGNHMNYGGPTLGIFACSGNRLLRQMPGRIIGLTRTLDGKDEAYCMVHQTREQHIRRERATSNICTNEALCAVAAAAYLALLGPSGLRKLCETILTKTHYAMKTLSEIDGVKAPFLDAAHFKEFTVNFDDTGKRAVEIHNEILKKGIHGGKILTHFPELGETALYCITEVHSRKNIDSLVEALREILR
ncbi:MAG: aminomethyl-transferring glycine dehydrogenase subunit GcvPA [Candidatus Bathyarchaeota archaeon]|jgi:glycine dehydrogenase subunit 1|nr:aminomethyl-transferring glycine dehydrogenase subunit GcvPA [Candidatus Bathyarchaeota archaeon]